MATHGDIGLSQPASGTTTFKLDAISLDANSTVVLREVMVLGSPETTNALMAVLNAAPASTAWAGVVRIAGGPSSVADLAVRAVLSSTSTDNVVTCRSSAADQLVTVYQSSQAALKGTVYQSTIGDLRASAYQSTVGDLRAAVYQSTAADCAVTVHGNLSSNSSAYLPVRLTNGTSFLTASVDYEWGVAVPTASTGITGPTLMFRTGAAAKASTDTWMQPWASTHGAQYVSQVTSSGALIDASTTTPAHGVVGLHVRQVASSVQSTTLVVTSSNSTVLLPLISSVAGLTHKVIGYFIGLSTLAGPSTVVFLSSGTGGDAGAAKNRWAVIASSGVWGANLAVNPPTFLFKTDASEALNCRIENASTAGTARISLCWVTE